MKVSGSSVRRVSTTAPFVSTVLVPSATRSTVGLGSPMME